MSKKTKTAKRTAKKKTAKKKENFVLSAIKQPYYWIKALTKSFYDNAKGKVKTSYNTVKKVFVGDGNSIRKDWWIAGLLAVGFFVVLKVVVWAADNFGITEAFNMVDFYVVAAKAAFVSALAWSLIKYVFAGTLGKDFGKGFDEGWKKMKPVEKTRWIIGVFVAIFVSLVFAF